MHTKLISSLTYTVTKQATAMLSGLQERQTPNVQVLKCFPHAHEINLFLNLYSDEAGDSNVVRTAGEADAQCTGTKVLSIGTQNESLL